MSVNRTTQEIWEEIRKLPVEVDEDKVFAIIQQASVATAQSKQPSFFNNFNITMMSAITVLSISIGLWMMFRPDMPKPINLPSFVPVSELVLPPVTTVQTQDTNIPSPAKFKSAQATIQLSTIEAVDSSYSIDTIQQFIPLETTEESVIQEFVRLPIHAKTQSSLPTPFQDSIDFIKPLKMNISGILIYIHKPPFEASFKQMRQLKKKLQQELKKDGIKPIRKNCYQIVYQPTKIVINGKKLDDELDQRYRILFLYFGISSGKYRQIQLFDNYIMAGDFNRNNELVYGTIQGSGPRLHIPLHPNPFSYRAY